MGTTTASLLTPPGRGGIAVILLRGPHARRICREAFRPLASHAQGGPGVLQLGHLVAAAEPIDEAVVHCREDCIEINIHGGPQAAKAAMEQLARLGATVASAAPAADASLQAAHPRWRNPAIGREMLELLPSAACALVVSALARQWSDGISRLARTALAEFDRPPGAPDLARIAAGLRAAACGPCAAAMKKLLHPPEVVLVGPPNAGKSTLTNALLGRQVSIIDQAPGTTRDWVREQALLEGVPVWLTDTAGIWDMSATGPPARGRGPGGGVQAESVRRARRRAEAADLVLLLSPGVAIEAPAWLHASVLLRVSTKKDLVGPWRGADLAVSAARDDGLDELRGAILRELQLADIDRDCPAAFTRRQADLLARAADATGRNRLDAARRSLRELLEGRPARRRAFGQPGPSP